MPISFSFFLHCIKHKEIYKLLCFCCVDKAIQGLFSNMKSSIAQKQEFIGVKEMYRRSKGKGGHWCKINSWCSWGHFDFFLLYKIFDGYKRDNKYTFSPPLKEGKLACGSMLWFDALSFICLVDENFVSYYFWDGSSTGVWEHTKRINLVILEFPITLLDSYWNSSLHTMFSWHPGS